MAHGAAALVPAGTFVACGGGNMALDFHILDVFTDRAFGGNPLAVVFDADGLSVSDMQSIAREFNLSETVFLLKAKSPGHTGRVRIFTPAREIPFAGHPTLGTAILLAELRSPQVNGEQDAIIALEIEGGNVRVGVRRRAEAVAYGEFDAPKSTASLQQISELDDIAAALGLIPTELTFENHKPTVLKGATTFGYVPISNLDAMAKVQVSPAHWSRAFTEPGIDGVYLYTRQCVRRDSAFHARMLAPDLGVAEDPATGSAAAGFAQVVHAYDGLTDGTHRRTIEQGIEMGRPSTILLTMSVQRGKLESVRIGGHAVRVAEGKLNV